MDIEKLIERLQNAAGGPEGIKMCQDAATAISDLLSRAESAEAAQETLQKAMAEYKARAERAEKCIAEIEEALKFGRVSAAMLQICEWRW